MNDERAIRNKNIFNLSLEHVIIFYSKLKIRLQLLYFEEEIFY